MLEALEAKAREVGGKYSYRDLERDSGVNYSYVSKVKGGEIPSKQVLLAWSQALGPHFPYEEALISAGYLPDDAGLRQIVRRLLNAPKEVRQRIERELGLLLFSEESPKRGQKQRRRKASHVDDESQEAGDSATQA